MCIRRNIVTVKETCLSGEAYIMMGHYTNSNLQLFKEELVETRWTSTSDPIDEERFVVTGLNGKIEILRLISCV